MVLHSLAALTHEPLHRCRYVHAIAFGCIPVFFQHSLQCARGMPLDELPGLNLRNCSLQVDLDSVYSLPATLKAVSSTRRAEMMVRSLPLSLSRQAICTPPDPCSCSLCPHLYGL